MKDPQTQRILTRFLERRAVRKSATQEASVPMLGSERATFLGRGLFRELVRNRTLFLMILPVLLFFLVFSYLPIVGVYFAFTNFNYTGGLFGSPFVGLKNFEFLFAGGKYAVIWTITRNTVLYNLAFIVLGNLLQMLVAIVISELPGSAVKKTSQTLMFLPHFISYVLVGVFAYNLFNLNSGFINGILKGLGMEPVNFYGTPWIWKYILVAADLWKGVGYGSVVYLAAVMGIDRSFYEAADIDGANIYQKIRLITLPLLRTTFVMLLLFGLGRILRGQFDLFYNLVRDNGMLFEATDIIDTYVYRSLIKNFDIGLGTAAGLYQSLFGFLIVVAANAMVRKVNKDYALF